jgi:hypothetical protein
LKEKENAKEKEKDSFEFEKTLCELICESYLTAHVTRNIGFRISKESKNQMKERNKLYDMTYFGRMEMGESGRGRSGRDVWWSADPKLSQGGRLMGTKFFGNVNLFVCLIV